MQRMVPEERCEFQVMDAENPEFPDEESIRQAVLADEFAAEQAQNTARKKEKRDAGSLLKDLIFGKE